MKKPPNKATRTLRSSSGAREQGAGVPRDLHAAKEYRALARDAGSEEAGEEYERIAKAGY